MTNAILIGNLIYDVIRNNSYLSEKLGERIWPLRAPNGATFPFAVYERTNIYSGGFSKDGYFEDKITFQIIVASKNYDETIYIANAIRGAFEGKDLSYDDLNSEEDHSLDITDIKLSSCSEDFSEETYVQILTFECSTY